VLKPSSYLDVEMKTIQQQLLDPKPMDFMMHEIAKATTGEAAKQSMAKRKLDALGNVRAHCGVVNDPKRLKRLKEQLALADSLAEISKQTQVPRHPYILRAALPAKLSAPASHALPIVNACCAYLVAGR
jgi:hypothetical protein